MDSFDPLPIIDLREMLQLLAVHAPDAYFIKDLEQARDGALAFLQWFVDTTTRKPLTGESLVLAAILLEVYR
jgi:hypothetical protein